MSTFFSSYMVPPPEDLDSLYRGVNRQFLNLNLQFASFNRFFQPIKSVTTTDAVVDGLLISGNVTFATTDRLLVTSNPLYTNWQGPVGAGSPGLYVQNDVSGGGLVIYGAGTGRPTIRMARSGGGFGVPTDQGSNTLTGVIFAETYGFGAYQETGSISFGISQDTNTPYLDLQVLDAATINQQRLVFNYDGKLYFLAPNDNFSPLAGFYPGPSYMQDPLANIYRSAAGFMKTDGSFEVGGALKLGNAYTAAVFAATGYITLQDNTGTTYKVGASL